MTSIPSCPQCQSQFTYEDGEFFICPECGQEWSKILPETEESHSVIKDAFGNVLKEGDMITVIKDLKIKGSSLVVKVGTKVKIIRFAEGEHDIDCKIEGIGQMQLKSAFVKKA